MSISALTAISMARPGIEARGRVASANEIEAMVRKEFGFSRRWLASWGALNGVPLLKRLPGVHYATTPREFLKHLHSNIEASGIKQKFAIDTSIRYDPESPQLKIPYDPAVDLGVVAVTKLLKETRIDPREIGGLFVACTTANSGDPPVAELIVSKLIRDGIVKKDHVERKSPDSLIGWDTMTYVKGCVGWIQLMEEIEKEMQSNSWKGEKNKPIIGLAIAANGMHMNGANPHEIIAYGDGSAAGLFVPREDNSGPLVFGKLVSVLSEAHRVVHPFKEPKLKWFERIQQHFTSNYMASKKAAHIISEKIPEYLDTFLEQNGLDFDAFEHIIISQTSKGILDKTIIKLAESFIARQGLGLDSNKIRPELKRTLDEVFSLISVDTSTFKGRNLLCNYFMKLIETNHGESFLSSLTPNEAKLYNFMDLLFKSIYRVYDRHGYTGVASIPMAIAQGIEDGDIALDHPMLMVGSGLGINVQGIMSPQPSYKRDRTDPIINAREAELSPKDKEASLAF